MALFFDYEGKILHDGPPIIVPSTPLQVPFEQHVEAGNLTRVDPVFHDRRDAGNWDNIGTHIGGPYCLLTMPHDKYSEAGVLDQLTTEAGPSWRLELSTAASLVHFAQYWRFSLGQVVAFGSSFHGPNNCLYKPCLWGYGKERILGTTWTKLWSWDNRVLCNVVEI